MHFCCILNKNSFYWYFSPPDDVTIQQTVVMTMSLNKLHLFWAAIFNLAAEKCKLSPPLTVIDACNRNVSSAIGCFLLQCTLGAIDDFSTYIFHVCRLVP